MSCSEKTLIFCKVSSTAFIIFSPSTKTGFPDLLRKAVCKTALFSVSLITSPENIFSIASFKSTSFASSNNVTNTSSLILFLEKSTVKLS